MYSSLYQFARRRLLPGHKQINRSLHDLEHTQWLSRSELTALQFKKLQNLVSYAYEHVPFYRERYQREHICPQDIRCYEDFQSLPVLTREDVKSHKQELVSREFRGEVFEESTSGSTGQPIKLLMEKQAAYWSYAAESRCRAWYGVRPGDKMARLQITHNSKAHWKIDLANKIKRYRWLDPRNLEEPALNAFAEILLVWHPVMFRGYPSALTVLAKYLKKGGIALINPRLVECTGELLTPAQRQLFAEVFRAPIADHYSSLEIYSIAYECPQGKLHVFEDRYLEILRDGRAVAPGESGEMTITSLNQYAMPFIRYQNGDAGVYELKACSCGRSMPVLREVQGRISDVFIRPDGHHVYYWSTAVPLMTKHEIYQYQIYQPDQQHLEVRLVCRQRVGPNYLENIRKELQPLFGDAMDISVKLVEDITPAKSGKRLFLISDVKPDHP
jgi:phenylacetate-CoA ligase